MIATTVVTIALGFTLAQAEGHGAAGHEQPVAEAHGEGHGGGHGAGGFSESLMHHVTDGYVIEYPGVCHGGFAWNCELDLSAAFGTVRDETGHAVSGPLVFGGLDMTPTKHVVMMWLACVLLFVMVVGATARRSIVPRGLYNFFEMLVSFIRNEIAVKNLGEKHADRFLPYLLTAFFFIFFINLFGLIPYSATATGNLAVTVTLALFTFFITQYAAIKAMGIGGWLKHLTAGVHPLLWPIMIPVELLGLFTKPFALTVRLFANMIAGHIVILSFIGLIFAIGSLWVAVGSVPMALAIFLLELFVAFVQAYIFTMLSSLFIGQGLAHHGDDHGHGEHAEHAHASHADGKVPGHG